MSNQRHLPNTKLISYLVHSPRWPNRGMNGSLSAGMILPSRTITWDESIDWVSLPITPDEKKKKEEITALYRSQMSYSKNFLLSFASSNELFFEINPLTLECFGENDESLTDKTFSAATPFRETYYWIHEDTFCLSAPLTNLLDGLGVFSVKLFPYKAEAPFELMPKIHMKLFGGRLFVRNGSHTVRRAGITYRLGTKRVLIRIPLSLLKNPEALFVSTQVTNKKALPNSGVWKILKIKNSCKKPSEIKII